MIIATVTGNLGRDAELKAVGSDMVLSFSVASTAKIKGAESTTWVSASIWGKRAEALAPFLKKGTKVAASGTLTTREFDGRNGKQTAVELRVSELDLMGGGAGKAASGGQTSPAASSGGGFAQPYNQHGGDYERQSGDDEDLPY